MEDEFLNFIYLFWIYYLLKYLLKIFFLARVQLNLFLRFAIFEMIIETNFSKEFLSSPPPSRIKRKHDSEREEQFN